jgi:phospholipase/carboxylesterase
MEYLVQNPTLNNSNSDKYPLILLLHGYGSNAEDLFSFAPELPKNAFVISLQAPHTLMYQSYAWYAINFDADENKFSDLVQAKESLELIKNQIIELCEKYPIDSENVTLIGFSQGAILSYAMMLSYPKMIKNIAALSGYINLDMATKNTENNYSHLSVFASHGTVDQVIPVDWARKTPLILNQLNIKNNYKEYNVGHGIAPQNFYDLLTFLKEN